MRALASCIIVIAFTTIIIGCSYNYKGAPHSGNDPAVDDSRGETGTPELRVYLSDQAMMVPRHIERYEQYISERAGVALDIVYLPHAQYLEQLNLKFAGSDFPDMYQVWSGPAPDLVSGGKVLALNDLIDQYGPNMKRFISQAAWDAVTVQGNIYAVPQPTETLQGSIMYIRKDWLDKLKLSVPRTSDELLDVMRAFRDGDPNGNGLPDEIPFTMREKLEWGENVFGMWGVNSKYTESYYNDELIMGSVHPRFLQGLDYMRTMYEEKLLDRDFLVNTLSIWDQKITAGLVGIWNHSPRSAWKWQQALEESIPEQSPEVIAIKTPQGAGYDGPVGSRWSTIGKTFIIMQDAKDPVAIIKYLDWLFSEEGRRFTEFGIEGETYTRQGDHIVFHNNSEADIDFLQKVIAAHAISAEASAAILDNPLAAEKLQMAYAIADAQGFTSETIGMPNISNDYNLHALFIEAAALVIIGERPLQAYHDFIEVWKSNGGQTFIDERTAWYRDNRLGVRGRP